MQTTLLDLALPLLWLCWFAWCALPRLGLPCLGGAAASRPRRLGSGYVAFLEPLSWVNLSEDPSLTMCFFPGCVGMGDGDIPVRVRVRVVVDVRGKSRNLKMGLWTYFLAVPVHDWGRHSTLRAENY